LRNGFIQEEIARSSYKYQQEIERNEKVIVGVNKFTREEELPENVFTIDDSIRNVQIEKLKRLREKRNENTVNEKLKQLKQKAQSGENVMPSVIDAVEELVSLGEIADVFRSVYGEYK
jgi:methylmalonyl-CoA mutase N-terminal domain/subunit